MNTASNLQHPTRAFELRVSFALFPSALWRIAALLAKITQALFPRTFTVEIVGRERQQLPTLLTLPNGLAHYRRVCCEYEMATIQMFSTSRLRWSRQLRSSKESSIPIPASMPAQTSSGIKRPRRYTVPKMRKMSSTTERIITSAAR